MADSLLLVYIYVLGIDYAFVLLGFTVAARLRSAGTAARARVSTRRRGLRLRRFVHLLRQFVRSLGQGLACTVHLRLVVRLQRLLRVGQRVFHLAAFGAGNFVSLLFQHLLNLVNHRVELVLGVDRLTLRLVFSRVSIGFLRHALDLFFRQSRRRRDRDLLVLLRGRVFRGHIENSVRVNIERDL